VTADRAPGAPGEGAGQGKRGRKLTMGPCVGEATAGGGVEAFVGGEWSPMAGEGRGMLLRLKGKERMVRRGQMCANRVWAVAHRSGWRVAMLRHKMARGSGFRRPKWARPVRGMEGGGGVLEHGREARRKGQDKKATTAFD
jgi:hypothetical protein